MKPNKLNCKVEIINFSNLHLEKYGFHKLTASIKK